MPPAQPPTEYDLPLASGITDGAGGGASKYWKDQFGQVGFTIAVSGSVTEATGISQLPAGYRPSHLYLCAVANGGTVWINPSGNICIYGKIGQAVIYAAGIFVAGS